MSDVPRRLHQQIQQKTPFRSRAVEATLDLFHTADVLRRVHIEFFARYGVTMQQYNVLRILRGAGSDGLPTLTIAERMIERTPGITRLIDRLDGKRLVRRERGSEDRRQVVCQISEQGLALLADVDGVIETFEEETLSMLSEAEQETLIGLLDRVRAGIRESAADSSD